MTSPRTAGAKRARADAPKKGAQAEAPKPTPETHRSFEGEYRLEIPKAGFEGPLDLLLHLIQQHELDILDIPIAFVTERFLTYLNLMRELSIDVASEYLVMAATLAHIKSKMLLPVAPEGQDDGLPGEEEEDPRAELVRRLLEYQKYKAAAADLAERGTLGRDVFGRGSSEPVPSGPAPFAKTSVFSLFDAFEKILKKTKVKLNHEVVFDRISITDRIVELTELIGERRRMTFEELLAPFGENLTRFDLVITFLALLEMCRLRLLQVYQAGPLAEIYLEVTSADGKLAVEAEAPPEMSYAEPSAVDPVVDEEQPAETPRDDVAPAETSEDEEEREET